LKGDIVARIDKFYGNRNRRKADDWGIDATRNSIAPDSTFATDRSRTGKINLVARIRKGMGEICHKTAYKEK
jgi:hypothetical protein